MLLATLLLAGSILSESPDTLKTAVVSAERGISVSRTDTVSIRTPHSVNDFLLRIPGLTIADNGGAAGLKTVSLRGLGSPHTAVYVDGFKVGNVQTGQPDLGMLGIENFGAAVVDYAQNSVNFSTSRPMFGTCPVAGRFSFAGGSFGTFLPQGRLDFRLSDKVSLSANAAGVLSRGNFPVEGGARRENNDIRQVKAGFDAFGVIDGGDWSAKLWYNGAGRGTPGSLSWPSTDRQKDRNAFAQGRVRLDATPLYSFSAGTKLSLDNVFYESGWGDSDYRQTEFQLNSAHRFRVRKWLELSALTDVQLDALKSTLYEASRSGVTLVAGAAFKLERFKADLTLQYEGIFDKDALSRNVVSPSAGFRFTALKGLDVVGFARRAFRAPTFNELYYPGYGNPDLKPEDALLSGLGADFRRSVGRGWTLRARLDFFYDYLKDKITSAPSPADPSLWLPYNIGEVRSAGIDAESGCRFSSRGVEGGLDVRYSFQNADNVPYLAKHTAVLSGNVSWRGWTLDSVWNLRAGRRDSSGDMPSWNTLDLILGKKVLGALTLGVACRNIFDARYELVTGYPMPGRSLLASVEYRF